jgi:hypothetical protein
LGIRSFRTKLSRRNVDNKTTLVTGTVEGSPHTLASLASGQFCCSFAWAA